MGPVIGKQLGISPGLSGIASPKESQCGTPWRKRAQLTWFHHIVVHRLRAVMAEQRVCVLAAERKV